MANKNSSRIWKIRTEHTKSQLYPNWRMPAGLLLVASLFAHPVVGDAQVQVPTTVQLPTFGVSIDAEGVLTSRTFAESGLRLYRERAAALRAAADKDLIRPSTCRKISLRRLDEQLAAAGKPSEEMLKLAGLTRIEYLFVYPEQGDIVIAGPAEGWIEDASDRVIGIESGLPILLLEDLATALRLFAPEQRLDRWVGCTIDPNAEGLERLSAFQRTIPNSIPNRQREAATIEIYQGMKRALGMADVRVFGVSPQSHLAEVLVEADYRMKLIGIGLEPPPIQMTTFLSASRSARHHTLQRWWFTPNYECLATTPDKLAMQMIGQGVQLLSEEYSIGRDGRLENRDQQPSRASTLYTRSFTDHYEQIAARRPIYAQLRQMMDVLIVAAFMNKFGAYETSDWEPTALLDEAILPTENRAQPRQAPCAVNAVWVGNRLLAPAGGGVSIVPTEALSDQNISQEDAERLNRQRESEVPPESEETWWWD